MLLLQCFYYRGFTWKDDPTPAPKPGSQPSERTALLGSNEHRERRGSDWAGLSPATPHIPEAPSTPPPPPTTLQAILWNTTVVVMVCAAGVLGWFFGQKAKGDHEKTPKNSHEALEFNTVGQVFGYLCMVAYIASRLPQLILNYRRKTTDGLSMLFFLFACLGNITYVLSIFAYEPKCGAHKCKHGEAGSIYGRYILVNLSWLAGSLVTLFMDFGVFVQYFIYRSNEEESRGSGENGISDSSRANGRDQWDQRPILSRSDSENP